MDTTMDQIAKQLEGEFNNFQQCWQENTNEAIHRVKIEAPHQHIHSKFKAFEIEGEDDLYFALTHREGRDSNKILKQEIWHFWQDKEAGNTLSERYALSINTKIPQSVADLGDAEPGILTWRINENSLQAQTENQDLVITIEEDALTITGKQTLFENAEIVPYRMLRCRFFSGWIEYPLPENPDSTFRMGNLKLHDQGGIIQLTLEDGTKSDYSVELTQLVYGKQIAIMKLAVYQEPFENIDYNSRAISYAWTSPEAKRLGINLRKIVSGWTLIEPGFINSNNMNQE